MSDKSEYYMQKEKNIATKYDNMRKLLPAFAREYLDSKTKVQYSTLLGYSRDLMTFFQFLKDKNPVISKKSIIQITIDDMASLKSSDIVEYTHYLGLSVNDKRYSNHKTTIARKFAPLNGMFIYYIKQNILTYNPVAAVEIPSEAKDKTIVRLKSDDIEDILDIVEKGSNKYSSRKKIMKERNRIRDYTIIKLLLNTGIRISECVGLDVASINFKRKEMTIVRKGGGTDELNLSDDIIEMLTEYICEYRTTIVPREGHEEALFYSLQGKRMSVSSIEKMVQDYGLSIGKKVTPHKFRGAYGTELYDKTGDIALVADVLGHNSIETTRKRYVDIKQEHKKIAAEIGPLF